MNTQTREQIAPMLTTAITYGDADGAVMRIMQVTKGNLPRDAREMSFAAQDYMADTKVKDRTELGLLDHMITAERREGWPA